MCYRRHRFEWIDCATHRLERAKQGVVSLPFRQTRLLRQNARMRCFSLMALAIVVPLLSRAEDWPRFLGPRGDNTSPETGLLDKFPTNGVPIVWEKKIGAGYSAPSVFGGRSE